ncbi:activating signal cointegrator 1 complex subunit 2-like [Ylistrum balloti]|uniref:activating signal cointegrator 1 complex subunit 2-like n=1 Tax=Ylistrum balloti TaxID=509963 RepID=UPI0029059F05|nr:activating signal cointegrator 1 complex subunit 2-like [Ylistrum balloti]
MSSCIPLDKLHVKVDVAKNKTEDVPALHPRWSQKIQFVTYHAPPLDISDRGQCEEWADRLKFIEEDLHWALQLPHDKFWCQIVFDETFISLIDSYLRYAPRTHDILIELPVDTKSRHDEVHRLVFMTCLRMATHKESKEHHITPGVFGEILYENFLFDIPKLLDLCVLYGEGNGQLLYKMIDNIFTTQPKYNYDLQNTIPTILQVFDNIRAKCGVAEVSGLIPKKLTNPGQEQTELVTMMATDFQDVVFYLADTGTTLASFLDVYPPACSLFFKEDFVHHLAQLYESVIPQIVTSLKKRKFDSHSHKMLLRQKTQEAKNSLLKVVHLIINTCCIQPLLENIGGDERVEDFIHVFTSILNERRFLADFESRHRFENYQEILLQSPIEIDEMRLQYIQDAISSAFTTHGRRRKPTGGTNRGGRTSPDGSPGPMEDTGAVGTMGGATGGAVGGAIGGAMGGAPGGAVGGADFTAHADNFQVESYEMEGACAARKTGVELESLISSVKDLLPDLGEGFIEVCLEEMDYNIERVINSVLEDKLPPSLQDMDRNMPREVSQPGEAPKSLLDGRRNVYDNDEFDVFSRDSVDTSRIFHGKQNKMDKISLDDKTIGSEDKFRLNEAYGYVVETVTAEEASQYAKLYDDEYDDTYDTNNVGADDADSADELLHGRPLTVPRILGGGNQGRTQKSSESESQDSEDEKKQRDHFVQDPALLRQKAEQRRISQRRGQGRRFGQGQGREQGQEGQKYDVKGKAKGQGQDADVLKNRKFKEKNKASRGNHNRRYMSDKKRMGFGGGP